MRLVLASLAAATVLGTAALAQTNTTPNTGSTSTVQPMNDSGSTTNQTNTSGSGNAAATVKPAGSPETTGSVEPGANSFTEGQVRSRLEAQGFTNVTELRKDDQGIWRGKATRNGQSTGVALDYKGTIQTQ